MTRALASLFATTLVVGCGRAAPPPMKTPAPSPAAASAPAPPREAKPAAAEPSAPAPLVFIEDDLARATEQAKAEHKLLFVDAWAEWCHTCASMRSYVLAAPELRRFGGSVVFAAINTDRPENAAFVDRYAIEVWPTFFAIEPASGRLVGYWPGSGSVREMADFLTESLDVKAALEADSLPADSPVARLIEAKAAQASEHYRAAADAYAAVIELTRADWPRRSEALRGWVQSLYHARDYEECAAVGARYLNELRGASMPADFLSYAFGCTRALRPAERASLRERLVARLRVIAADASPERSADDRADAYGILAGALDELHDRAGAAEARRQRLAILEAAAAAAPSPETAATFDEGRARAYLALGRAGDAVRLLEERERALPGALEPAVRLADVLMELERWADARAALERALPRAYGKRKVRILEKRAEVEGKLGDRAARLATLEAVVAAWRELAHGGAPPAGLADAERELAAARRAAGLPVAKPKGR
ncbi:MAG: thioredoxin family protein [Sorangiineae bacterium]|nr:thioredoxin family protein [Polyangiaceae bacterium]MEB2322816.1 thioredoxin family protein [Sorangiineae bacterium]